MGDIKEEINIPQIPSCFPLQEGIGNHTHALHSSFNRRGGEGSTRDGCYCGPGKGVSPFARGSMEHTLI